MDRGEGCSAGGRGQPMGRMTPEEFWADPAMSPRTALAAIAGGSCESQWAGEDNEVKAITYARISMQVLSRLSLCLAAEAEKEPEWFRDSITDIVSRSETECAREIVDWIRGVADEGEPDGEPTPVPW